MHHTTEIYKYYQHLAQTSAYLQMQQVSTTEEGRPIKLVIIGSEDALKEMDKNTNKI